MDELVIQSKFMQKIISNVIKRLLIRKYKCVADVNINNLKVSLDDGTANVHLDLDANCSKADLEKLFKAIGLN